MALPRSKYHAYRGDLKSKARQLRRDPTPPERKLWFEFLSAHPAKFTRQKPLGRYIADFYCSRAKLVVELDGDSHFHERGERYDAERSRFLQALGIRMVRFTNADVMEEFEAVCARIDAALGV